MSGLFDDIISPTTKRSGGLFDDVFSQEEEERKRREQQKSGFFGGLGSAVTEGAEKTYRSARAALSTYLGLSDDVVTQAGETARIEQDSRASDLKALKQDIQQRKLFDDDSIWSGIKNVAGAVVDNPRGAVQLVAEQAPNSAVSLGSGLAGAKAGALVGSAILPGAGTAVGGTIGFLAGLFGANTLLETGGKAIEASQDKQFTPEERSQAIREGTTKGAVITAVDAATFGASKFVLGAANRAVEQATVRTLGDAGVDAAKAAAAIRQAQREALDASRGAGRQASQEAVEKATVEAMGTAGLLKPDLVLAVQAAQKSAFDTTTTLGKRAGRGGAALGLQSFGEGLGEGLGEYAATGKFSPTETVLESVAGLSMSLPELYVAKGLNAPGELTSAYSARRPDAPPPPPPPPGALEQLGTATQELEQAVTSYLTPNDVMQSASVDEAVAKAAELVAAPLPGPTLDERILTAGTTGLVARQLDIQRQLDEQAGFDLPPSPTRGAAPAQLDLQPLQPGQARLLSESPTFDQAAGTPGLQPGQARVLTRPSVFDEPAAGTPGLQPGQTRALSQPSVFKQPAGTPGMQPGQAQIVPPPLATAPSPAQRALDREAQLLEQREGTPANPIPERLRLDAQRRDEAAGLIESNPQATPEILARANALRSEAQRLRSRADEVAAASAASAQPAAGTQFEREQLDAQAAVNRGMRLPAREAPASGYADLTPMTPLQARQRLAVIQDETGQPLSFEIAPHPTEKGSFAIAQRELPSAADLNIAAPAPAPVGAAEAQYRIESAELGGREQQRKRLDEGRQIVVTRALKNVEERGGVASPQEAQIFQEANLGRPYDSVDESLGPKPGLVLPRMEERGPATTGAGIITDSGTSTGNRNRQERGFGVNAALDFAPTGLQATTSLGAAPNTRVDSIEPTGLVRAVDEPAPAGGRSATKQSQIPAAPGIPGVADTLNVNLAGQTGATDEQNAALLGEPRDSGTELAKQRVAAGYQAPPAAPRPQKVGGTAVAQLTSAQLTQMASDEKLPAITRRGAQIELGYRASETSATAPATAAALPQTTVATPDAPKLDQAKPGVILTSSAKMSSARPAAPGATGTLNDNGTQHTYTVVDPGKLGMPGRMLSQVARIFGKKLVVFESGTLKSDGFVLDDDNSSVYLNARSSVSPLAVFGHEMVHLLKRDNAPAYAALEAVVKRNVDAKGMAKFKADYGQGANLEELASDLTGNRFQEPEFWTDVFNEIAAQNPTGARAVILKVAAALNKAVNAFKRAVSGQGFKADQYVKDLDAVKAAVKTAVVQYAQQQREPAMRMEAELMRAESQVNLTAGSSSPASVSQAAPTTEGATAAPTPAAPTRATAAAASVDDELAEVEAQSARFSRVRPGPANSAKAENRMAVVVGAKPGEFNWSFTRSDLPPPPFAAPTQYGPRLEKIGESVYEILRSNGFKKLAEDAFGVKGLRVAPLHGSWLNKPEPSFALYADALTFDQANDLSKMLGFAFAQDATVVFQPTSEQSPGEIPAVYVGGGKKLTEEQMKALLSSAQAEGIDYSSTADGKAIRFLHFGDAAELAELTQKAARIASNAGLGAPKVVLVRSQLNESESYTKGRGQSDSRAEWVRDGGAGRSDLFRRTVDHVLVPYAKAVGSEGYRFAVSRFGQRFGLSADQQGLIRQALLPRSGADKATVDIASGKVKLNIKPTGARGAVSVSDILWALQNRSAQAGLIEPGDYSDPARKLIAEAIAEEVIYNVNDTSTGKSAIGWYDRALKAAKKKYAGIFPELEADRDRGLLFDAVLGITSQGNDVFSNSLFAARVYQLVTRQNMTLSQAVSSLKGSFGGETVAIENNILKLEELIDRNGYEAMRKFFNKKDTVSKINARLRADTSLFYKNKPLAVEGAADQRVTGWMVFGPKIGSFINNLHGDYSTLTADLWFSRTWNRILGFSFVHAPAREAEQYQTFMSAVIAEYGFAKDREGPIQPKRVLASGEAKMPEFGSDAAELTSPEVEQIIADPDEALRYATELEAVYRKGGYKAKSDLRRAAKNWIENRNDPVALPRTDYERDFQQRTVETAQKIIKRRTGTEITIADIQAALWYYEKDNLFKLLGGTNKKSEAADYAGAAEETVRTYEGGNLFYAKTDDRYVYGSKDSYLQGAQLSRARKRSAADISIAELQGRQVSMPVRVEDTGETGTLTMDAGDSLADINEREAAMQRLLECLRK